MRKPLLASYGKTKRLIIRSRSLSDWRGFGAEVSAMVMEKAFDNGRSVIRIASRDTPMPFNDKLEAAVIPTQERILVGTRHPRRHR